MVQWRVPLSDVRFTEAQIEAVAEVLRSGWLSQGPKVEAFEGACSRRLSVAEAVAVANGTAALHLICVALGLGPGDEVIVPSITFAATAAVIRQVGATPVFAEIAGLDQPWLSAKAVDAAITPRTRAVIIVAYGGHAGELLELRALTDRRGLSLVEDASHAIGADASDGVAVGTVGVAAAFSFFANKNLPLGEGGLVVTNDPMLAQRVKLLRSHGLTSGTWSRHQGHNDGYDVLEPGFNYRLDESRAALGLLLLEQLDFGNDLRADHAARYATALEEMEAVRPALTPVREGRSAWHIYPVVLDSGVDRGEVRRRMASAGIQTSVHYPALHQTTAFAVPGQSLPLSERYAQQTVTLPLFPHMDERQQGDVIDALATALAGAVT